MSWYQGADKSIKGTSGGTYTGGPYKGVLHSTEGGSASGAISAFKANTSWPHFLIDYSGKVYQFLDTNQAARALANKRGGVETNRDSAIQIEIVGFAGKPRDHPVAQMDALRLLMRWIEQTHGVKPVGPGRPFASSYGQNNLRFTSAEWDSFGGHCGHCHVPEGNDHWDPGQIDLDSLLPKEILPMHNPPFDIPGGVAAHLKAPGGGMWIFGSLGHVYAFDCPHYGQPAGEDYWGDRRVAYAKPNGEGYTIVPTNDEKEHYDYS